MRSQASHIVEQILAAVLLLLLSPALLLIGGFLLLVQGRPVFFLQGRAGLGGKTFTIFKFRTMGSDANRGPHNQRVTRFGRILRRFGLDELPQLLNIVRGEMSFVGPRPTLPEQVDRYGAAERRRLAVRPGLTGWAQVHGRNAISWDERIVLDLWYIENRSLVVNLGILVRTWMTVLAGEGVYGDEGMNPDFRPAARTIEDTTRVT